MRFIYAVVTAWICLSAWSSLAADAQDADIFADPDSVDGNPAFDPRGSGQTIDPGMISRTLEGPSEADRVDTPAEELFVFAITLLSYYRSNIPLEFTHLDPSATELDVVLGVANRAQVLTVQLEGRRRQLVCQQLRRYMDQEYTTEQSVQMAIDYYESSAVRNQEQEEVSSYIREEIGTELGSEFLSDFEREAELFGERSSAHMVSSRSFFGLSDDVFLANCKA